MMSVEQRLEFCQERMDFYRNRVDEIAEREKRTGEDDSTALLAAIAHHALMEERARELEQSLGEES